MPRTWFRFGGLPLLVGGLAVGVVAAPPAYSGPAPTPSASAAPSASALGKLKREAFEAALKPHLSEMRDCYLKALKKDAVAEGEVVIMIETAGGKVLKGEVDRNASKLKLEDALKCVEGVLKKIKMPIAKNGAGEEDPKLKAVVKYPIEFSLGIDVGAGPSKTTGAKLDYDKVKQVFFINKIEIGRCWVDAQKAKKGAAAIGKVMIKVEVAGGAVQKVEEVAADTTVTDKTMKDCILEMVKKFKFPVAKDGKGADDEKAATVITYPLDFL